MAEQLYRLAAFAVNAFSIAVYVRARPDFNAQVLLLLRRAANIARAVSLFGLLGLYVRWSTSASHVDRSAPGTMPSPRWIIAIVAIGVIPSVLALLARSKARA